MSISAVAGSFLAAPGQSVALGSLFSVTADAGNPPYLVLSGLDRNEYTATATGSMGTLSGNGTTVSFSSIDGEGYGAGIVFTYNATTGQYTNTVFGNLANVTLTASSDATRNESFSLFGTNDATNLAANASNPYALEDMTTYLGSVSVVTAAGGGGAQPAQATPNSIVSAAASFIGKAWNENGCWVLASNISAKAGASLPLTSTSVGVPGVANGEWIVAYDGPAGQSSDWQSMVKAGEMVVFATSATSGHITTCVAGTGASAELVDNITYVDSTGKVVNPANDGSSNDILIATPHLASQEFAQAVAGSVVIYELDTPTVSAAAGAPTTVALGSQTALSSLVTASDPGTRAVTQYQVYDTGNLGAAADTFVLNGAAVAAHSAATAIPTSAAGLASTYLQAAASIGVDTLEVRAFNGTYWGDWTPESVAVLGTGTPSPSPSPTPAPTASAPVVSSQTSNQVWMARQDVDFQLAAGTFSDPQGSALTFSASQVKGRSFGLTFDPTTQTFSGTVCGHRAAGRFEVTAMNADGLSTSEYFKATIAANASQFTHAVSALNGTSGLAATSLHEVTTHVPHTLASPTARA